MFYHHKTVAETLGELRTDKHAGLSSAEAKTRLAEHGPNELQAAACISPWEIMGEQFKNVLIIILLLATALSLALGHGIESVAIAVIVLFAVFLGFIQEYRAERAMEALRRMAAPTATVLRDGSEIELPARDLVPGDIIMLQAGDKVPADARLIEAINLQAEEAALTGESLPVEKTTEPMPQGGDLPLGDRRNMTFAGTVATYGRGRAVVTATGMGTEFGKIAQMLQAVETGRTPLQENLDRMGRLLARAALALVGVIVAFGLFRGQPFIEMLIFGIALAVAVVPEALPAVVTISLAIGVQRMVKRHALMRRLPTVETLGSVTFICSDKTGTLTKDEMTVVKIYAAGEMTDVTGTGYQPSGEFLRQGAVFAPDDGLAALLRAGVLCSDACLVQQTDGWDIKGDPTEGAMVVAAAKAGLHKADLDLEFKRVQEIPFTSESKRMTTLHESAGGPVAYAKGAPEVILDSCARHLSGGREKELDPRAREEILAKARQMAGQALRVIAVASKADAGIEQAEQNMLFLGLFGMIDPPRPEVVGAIRKCEEAGIKTVMITGDHPDTARAIAKALGILKNGRLITGAELEALSDEDFARQVKDIEVYARVSPSHKLKVVTALQARGHIVSMTGDGVNDAPALKKADIGIAMGITGTDVTKEAAAMTLTDDNFTSIVAAVEEGRGIYGNIKKYLMFLLSSNIGEIGLMAGAILLGLPLPLTAVQILYVNLATDGLPALALAVDPPEDDLMKRPPRNPRTGIFTRPITILMAVGGLWSAAVNLGIFIWAMNSGRDIREAMTMTFVSLVLIQFFKAYNFRSDRLTVLKRPFANNWLNLAVLWELLLLGLIVYLPFLHKPFGTYSLPALDLLIITILAFSVSPVLELTKVMVRRGWLGKDQ
ncbi:cation-translocating P-type ATPase [candidate division TA06 bacterium]|uniref:Cation-translocating P-type ATPase n=1 Tax=candidate division TA06 bacterium TaxID=2250710 RepID=A0A933I7W3_UNCT6|nr:cation-translocating P-type ATPase [candidate division TA06 bacterium]